MIVCHLFQNINVDTSQILQECFPHQGQGSYYVVQLPDHRVHVYNQWWTNIRGANLGFQHTVSHSGP